MKYRLKQLREHNKMTVAVFARLCNMSASLESRLENGETNFSEDSISRILKGTRVNKEWFMDGTGEMYPSNQTVGDRLKQLRTELKLMYIPPTLPQLHG